MVKLNKNYKIGMRAIKTAFAVAICALFSTFLSHEDILCSSIAALICMEPTYQQTISTGINRFIGTIIGGIVGYVALELIAYFPYGQWLRVLALPICILLVVYVCNLIDRKQSVQIGCVVIIVILSRLGSDKFSNSLTFVVERVIDTTIGIVIAGIINRFQFRNIKHTKHTRPNK